MGMCAVIVERAGPPVLKILIIMFNKEACGRKTFAHEDYLKIFSSSVILKCSKEVTGE